MVACWPLTHQRWPWKTMLLLRHSCAHLFLKPHPRCLPPISSLVRHILSVPQSGSRPIPESRPQEQSRRASATDAVPKNAMIGEGIKADKMKIDRVPAQRKAPIRKEKAPLPVAKRKIQIEGEDFGRAKRQKDVLVTGQLRTQQDVRPAVSNPETVSNAANPTAPRGPPLSALTATRLKPPSLMKSKASAPTAAMPVQPPLPLTANNLRKWLVSTKLSDFVAIETTDGVKQPTPLVSTILTDSRAFASNNPELLRDALTLAWKGMQTPSAWQECTTQSATSGSAQEQFRALPFASNKEAVIAEALPNEEKVVILFLAVLHSVSPEVLKATTHWMKEAMTSAAVAQRDVPELCRLARALTSIFLFLQRSEDCFSLAHDILRHVENREKSTFMVDNICGLWPDAMAKCLQQDLRAAMAASFKYDFSLVLEGSTRFGTNAAFSAHSETIDDLITRLVPSFFGSATPPQTHELAQAISLLVIRLPWQDAYSLFEEIWGCKEEKLLETVELIGEIFHRGRGYSSPPSGIESIRQTLFSYLETLDVANDGVWPAAAATAQALWRISVNDERWYANLKVWLD
ncbi:hypothetical protein DFJ73DRAFT_334194 [Zopfochytrium polystomum]|nr:hypothetical protein DFJ73DRAFT_334194 [Zopfochytrium polystomum]